MAAAQVGFFVFNLKNTLCLGRHFNADKTQFASYNQPNNRCSIDLKIHAFVLNEKSSFNMLGPSSRLN